MNGLVSVPRVLLRLPPKGTLEQNGPDDPLRYYYYPFVCLLYRHRINQALSLLTPPYESILEVGYGSGILLPTLASIGRTVYGIDLDSDPARVKFNLVKVGVSASLLRGDISHTNYTDNSFDLIVAISVFEHILEPEPAINEIFRLLKPNGDFLVGMPRVDTLMKIVFPLIGYHNIEAHHVTDYRHFLKLTRNRFELIKFAKMPSFVPSFAALYFNMLFRKPNRIYK